MKWIGNLIALLAIIVPIVLFVLGNDEAEVVYTTSDFIPLNSTEESDSSNIQQIEVKNIGEKPAKDIQIKIDGEIEEYHIYKDSETDTLKEFPNDFELVYGELPPEGSFKLVIESPLNGLSEDVLTVKSENGLARNGLEDNTSPFTVLITLLVITIVVIINLWNIFISFRDLKVYSKIQNLTLYPNKHIDYINTKKPFYFKERDWSSLLKSFVLEKFKEDHFLSVNNNIEDQNSFYILRNNKPKFMTEGDWTVLRDSAKRILLLKVNSTFFENYSHNSILELVASLSEIKDKLPNGISLEISKIISKNYIQFKMNQFFITVKDINHELANPKPSFVNTTDWERYLSFLEKLQYMYILLEIHQDYKKPIEVITKYEKHIQREKNSLIDTAYNIQFYDFISKTVLQYIYYNVDIKIPNKPDWMKDDDYRKVMKILRLIDSNSKKHKVINNQLKIISEVVTHKKLPDSKPDYFSESQWRDLRRFEEELNSISNLNKKMEVREKELITQEKDLNSKTEYANNLKDIVVKQLNIINDVLNDPTTIDRIESHSNPFAIGNYENLKTLAEQLKMDGSK